MTKAEWLACDEPSTMLAFLQGRGVSERKLRLFAAGCCRRIWHLLADARSRKGVEVAERYAEGRVGPRALEAAGADAWEATEGPFDGSPRDQLGAYAHAAMAAWWLLASPVDPEEVAGRACGATVCDPDDPEEEEPAQAHLLRDIFGRPPFRPRPPLGPGAPGREDARVTGLARAAYKNRTLPSGTLDPVRLAVLADALEDAGCADAELLGHLRGPGPHVRGCWAVDLLLRKE